MILELIAALSAGFAAFGITLMVNAVTGRRMARWAFPVAFGAGMIAFTIWSEYSWASRSLPEGTPYAEAERTQETVWYRPWTWVVAPTTRLLVLDQRFTRINPAAPDLVLTRIVRLGRYMPESGFLAVIDCAGSLLAPMLQGVEFAADGTLEGASWTPMPEGDPVLTRACALREELSDVRGQGS